MTVRPIQQVSGGVEDVMKLFVQAVGGPFGSVVCDDLADGVVTITGCVFPRAIDRSSLVADVVGIDAGVDVAGTVGEPGSQHTAIIVERVADPGWPSTKCNYQGLTPARCVGQGDLCN